MISRVSKLSLGKKQTLQRNLPGDFLLHRMSWIDGLVHGLGAWGLGIKNLHEEPFFGKCSVR